jgi:hypothetical protein
MREAGLPHAIHRVDLQPLSADRTSLHLAALVLHQARNPLWRAIDQACATAV